MIPPLFVVMYWYSDDLGLRCTETNFSCPIDKMEWRGRRIACSTKSVILPSWKFGWAKQEHPAIIQYNINNATGLGARTSMYMMQTRNFDCRDESLFFCAVTEAGAKFLRCILYVGVPQSECMAKGKCAVYQYG
jgi:hypothetical protein